MDEAKVAVDAAMNTAKDGVTTALEAASVIATLLTGLLPGINRNRMIDKWVAEAEKSEADLPEEDKWTKPLMIPNGNIQLTVAEFEKRDIKFVIADVTDTPGYTMLRVDSGDLNRAELALDDIEHSNADQYIIRSNDPGLLVATVGDGQDHEVFSVSGVPQDSAILVGKELANQGIHFEINFSDDVGYKFSVIGDNGDDQKLVDTIKDAILISGSPEATTLGLDRERTTLLRQVVGKNINPITGQSISEPFVIRDKLTPERWIELSSTGCVEYLGQGDGIKKISVLAPNNPEYKQELMKKIGAMAYPGVMGKQEFMAARVDYVVKIDDYNDRIAKIRADLEETRIKCLEELKPLTEQAREFQARMCAALNRQLNADEALEEARNRTILDKEELKTFEHDMEEIERINGRLDTARQKAEEKEKEVKPPALEEDRSECFNILEDIVIRESRRKNEYRSVKLILGEDGQEPKVELMEDIEYRAPIERAAEAEALLREACAKLNDSLSAISVSRTIETPTRGQDEPEMGEPEPELTTDVRGKEADVDVTRSDDSMPEPNEEFE